MKPYTPKLSPRPGCACCNVKTLHGYKPRKNDSHRRAIRSGKKTLRQAGKKIEKETP